MNERLISCATIYMECDLLGSISLRDDDHEITHPVYRVGQRIEQPQTTCMEQEPEVNRKEGAGTGNVRKEREPKVE